MPRPLVTAKTEVVRLRVTPADKRRWQAAAKRERRTLSDWLERIVDAALTPPPPA
jgi:hypothetical protein